MRADSAFLFNRIAVPRKLDRYVTIDASDINRDMAFEKIVSRAHTARGFPERLGGWYQDSMGSDTFIEFIGSGAVRSVMRGF